MASTIIVKSITFKSFDFEQVKSFLDENRRTQIVSASSVFGKKHALHSVNQTLKAFAAGRNLARREEMEFLLRLSGMRQIERALAQCAPTKRSVFISWAENAGKVYAAFMRRFDAVESPLREPAGDALKNAIEKTATFWLE